MVTVLLNKVMEEVINEIEILFNFLNGIKAYKI
jgi:hypothetical protein